jgi:hypothetical protein
MRKAISRFVIFIITFFLTWSLVTKPAQASVWDWLKTQFSAKEATTNMASSLVEEGVSGEKHVTETTSNLLNVINLHIMGGGEEMDGETSMFNEAVGSGLISVVNSGIVAMYDPPASSVTYVADVLQNAKIMPQAQAQGLGFAALDPILETWKNFRNVAYLFFVVIFLIIGFMIMFRAKIGQAAITVQQAIPSIIVAMLAVTFSYAIAGFLIDLMYLLMYMLTTLIGGETTLITGNIFNLIGRMFDNFGNDVRNTLRNLISGLLGTGWLSTAVAWLSSLSAIVIIGLAILFSSFKIFFELLKSYIAIILQIVFAPVILMVGAIPGKNTFVSWLKNLTGNLIMWPLVLICLLVNSMLTTGKYVGTGTQVGGFMPPFLLGQGQGAAFPALVAIGILLTIPEIMKEAKKKLGVEEGIMGSLAGAAIERTKKAFPLGGRVGLGATGALAGGPIGAIGGGFKNIPKAIGQMRMGDVSGGFGSIGKGIIQGFGTGVKQGAHTGVNTAINVEHSAGLNQPDILNPVTHFIDTGELPIKTKPTTPGGEPGKLSIGKGFATGKNRERATHKQEVEDSIDLMNRVLGKNKK